MFYHGHTCIDRTSCNMMNCLPPRCTVHVLVRCRDFLAAKTFAVITAEVTAVVIYCSLCTDSPTLSREGDTAVEGKKASINIALGRRIHRHYSHINANTFWRIPTFLNRIYV